MSTEPLNSLLDAGTGMDAVNEKLYGVKYAEPAPERNGHSLNNLTVRYSPTLGKLALALSQAQLEYKPIKKQVENAFYSTDRKKAMYADLAAIIEATQKALASKELVVIQSPVVDFENKRAGIVSKLIHSSGEWSEVEMMLPATGRVKRWKDGVQVEIDKFDAQTCGAAQSYCRRYTYGPQIGVAAEEDDDANSIGEASGGSHEAQKAVAERKIKAAVDSGKTPALFYVQDAEEKDKFYVTGDLKLIEANVELLRAKGKWMVKDRAFITDANGIEDYKYELSMRGVPFLQQSLLLPRDRGDLTEPLRESIAQAKAAKKDA